MEITFKKPNKNHSRPFIRYQNFSIMESKTEKYPEMVELLRGPSWARKFFGKKYINVAAAIKSVELLCAERMIQKQSMQVDDELFSLGLMPV
jgi:hypothetical protein